jgi:hypothetical protein
MLNELLKGDVHVVCGNIAFDAMHFCVEQRYASKIGPQQIGLIDNRHISHRPDC